MVASVTVWLRAIEMEVCSTILASDLERPFISLYFLQPHLEFNHPVLLVLLQGTPGSEEVFFGNCWNRTSYRQRALSLAQLTASKHCIACGKAIASIKYCLLVTISAECDVETLQ